MQLLKRLSVNDKQTTLKVVAGFKKDTRQVVTRNMFEGYIDKQECIDLFNERFALMKAKNSEVLRSVNLYFDYADDKRNYQLILCDYICNYRFTRNKPVYNQLYKNNITYGMYIGVFYDEENIFTIKGGTEDEKVVNYLTEGGYSLALFDICAGVICGDKCCQRVYNSVAELTDLERNNVLNSLKNFIHNIVINPHKLSQAEKIIERAEILVNWFEMKSIPIPRFKLDILLYKLTVLDHKGKLGEMNSVIKDCEDALRGEIVRSENLNYYFIFYNRYAVYCMDIFDFEKAGEILENVLNVFTDYKVVLSSLPFIEMDDECIISDQYARLMGTKAQYELRILQQKKEGANYHGAIAALDGSIRNFRWESDRVRQYQIRADLEALCGNYIVAKEYLYKGCGMKKWEEFFRGENIHKTFELLHLSTFVRFLSRFSYNKTELNEIIRAFWTHRKILEKNGLYPEFAIAANIAEAMENLRFPSQQIINMYRIALNTEESTPALDVLKLIIHGGMTDSIRSKFSEADCNLNDWNDRYEKVLSEEIPEQTEAFVRSLQTLVTEYNWKAVRDMR